MQVGTNSIPMFKSEIDFESKQFESKSESDDRRSQSQRSQHYGEQFRLLQLLFDQALQIDPEQDFGASDGVIQDEIVLYRDLVAATKRRLAAARKLVFEQNNPKASYQLARSESNQASIRKICRQVNQELADQIRVGFINLIRHYQSDPACLGED